MPHICYVSIDQLYHLASRCKGNLDQSVVILWEPLNQLFGLGRGRRGLILRLIYTQIDRGMNPCRADRHLHYNA